MSLAPHTSLIFEQMQPKYDVTAADIESYLKALLVIT